MTSTPSVLAALLLLATSAATQTATDWHRAAFVRVEVDRRDGVVGELLPVRIVIGVERIALQQHAVQLFRRQLGWPVQVVAPWFAGADRPGDPAGPTIVVNDAVVTAVARTDESRNGSVFAVLAVERRLPLTAAGERRLLAPQLRLAFASGWRTDFVQGRVPLDRTEVVVDGAEVVLSVRDLPDEGRPSNFTGAVGAFTVRATATPRELAVGESLRVELVVSGDGDLHGFAPPPVGAPGFHVFGVLDRGGERERVLVYELSPLDVTVQAVPPIGLAFYAPGSTPPWRTAWTEAMPLCVHAAGAPPATGAVPDIVPPPPPVRESTEQDLVDIQSAGAMARDCARGWPDAAVVAILAAPWLLAASWWLFSARRRTPSSASAADLARELLAAAERRDLDLMSLFDRYLAARHAVAIDRDAGPEASLETLRAAGLPDALVQRTLRIRQSLVAGRYLGVSAGVAAAAHQLVLDLESAAARPGP